MNERYTKFNNLKIHRKPEIHILQRVIGLGSILFVICGFLYL